jgi:hypothetical protein
MGFSMVEAPPIRGKLDPSRTVRRVFWRLKTRRPERGSLLLVDDDVLVRRSIRRLIGDALELEDAARISDTGNLLWALSSASGYGDGSARGQGSAAMPDAGLLVGGSFWGAVNFDANVAEGAWLVSSSDEEEPFAAIYTEAGELDWLVRLGSSWDYGSASSFDALSDGTFFVAGAFEGDAAFNIGDDEYETISATDQTDGFLLHICP